MARKERDIMIVMVVGLLASSWFTSGDFDYGRNRLVASASAVRDFPVEQYVWDTMGYLIHYNWGFSVYIYINSGNFYYLIEGGSEYYEVYFSIDPANADGYYINGMYANYLLSSVGYTDRVKVSDAGLFKWNSTSEAWFPVVLANMSSSTWYVTPSVTYMYFDHSASEEVGFMGGQGKVSLSLLGNPSKVWMIFRAIESEPIAAPQNSFAYLDLANMLAAAFVVQKNMTLPEHPGSSLPYPEPVSWAINRLETANTTVILRNYGTNILSEIDVDVAVPEDTNVLAGRVSWRTNLYGGDRFSETLVLNRTRFGTSSLRVSLAYNGSGNERIGPIILPQKLTMVPRVSLKLEVPENVVWMQSYSVNLTVVNEDPFEAIVVLSPVPSWRKGDAIKIKLDPLTNVTVYPRVTIEERYMWYAAFFEGIKIQQVSANFDVSFHAPEIRINNILVDKEQSNGYIKMTVGETHVMSITVTNMENASYSATLSLKGWHEAALESIGFIVNQSNPIITLEPNSSATVNILILPFNASLSNRYTALYLSVDVDGAPISQNEIMIELIYPSTSFTPLISPVLWSPEAILIYAIMFLLGILVKAMLPRSKQQEGKAQKRKNGALAGI